MKKIILRRLVELSFIQLLVIFPLKAQDNEFVRTYNKVFDAGKDTRLVLINKYGNIDIKDWDKNSISIDVEVIVKISNENTANKFLDKININFSETGNTKKAETIFDKNYCKGFRFCDNNEKFEINYSVFMPKNVTLDLLNKYGSVFINEITSTSKIEVKYGKLKANRILHSPEKPLTQIVLGYSDGTIEECTWTKFDIKYSKIQINDSKALVIVSKYSKINLDKVSSVVSESKYDTYRIGEVQNFVTTAIYTNFKFETIGKKLSVETKYSDFIVNYMPIDFEIIKINNNYGSYKIGIDSDASYIIDGYGKYSKIIYPTISTVNRTQENDEVKVIGLIGNNRNTTSAVKIDTKYGNIKLSK